jgi:hypothetical protein
MADCIRGVQRVRAYPRGTPRATLQADPARPHGLDVLSPAERAAQTHARVYVVEEHRFCTDVCPDGHVNSETGTHATYQHVASTRQRAEAYIVAHATTAADVGWEIWECAVDRYDPYEEPDDATTFWQYAGDGTPLTPYQWWARYEQPLFGWDWDGAPPEATP